MTKEEISAKAKEAHDASKGDAAQTARTLRDRCEFDVVDIAWALHYGLDLSIDVVSRALSSEDGLGLSIEEITKALNLDGNANPIEHFVQMIFGENPNPAEIALALHSDKGLGFPIEEVTYLLGSKYWFDIPAETVALVLFRILNVSPIESARLLHCVLNLSYEEIARALSDGLGLPASAIAVVMVDADGLNMRVCDTLCVALKNGLGLADSEVDDAIAEVMECVINRDEIHAKARKIYASNKGDAAQTAKALRCGLNLSAVDVAEALYSPYGCNLAIVETARALKAEFELTPINAIQALKTGCNASVYVTIWALGENGVSAEEIAEALYSPKCLDLDAIKTARILSRSLDLDTQRVITMLRKMRVPIEQIARAMEDGLELTIEEIFKELWCVHPSGVSIRLGPSDIAKAFYSEDGLDLDIADVAMVLHSPLACGLPDDIVAQALMEGCELPVEEVYAAVKRVGIDPNDTLNQGIK